MPKTGSLAIAVLAKEWVAMPFLSEIVSENLSLSSLFPVMYNLFVIAIAKDSVNGSLGITFQYCYR